MSTMIGGLRQRHQVSLCIVASALCGGFGNALESVSILAFLQIFLLLCALNLRHAEQYKAIGQAPPSSSCCGGYCTAETYNATKLVLFVSVANGIGFLIGYEGLFGYPSTTFLTLAESFGAGFLSWLGFSLFSLLPYTCVLSRQPSVSWSTFLVFPLCHTFVTMTVIGTFFSTFTSQANAMLDYEPLRQSAGLFGIAFANFVAMYCACALAFFCTPPFGSSSSNFNNFSLSSKYVSLPVFFVLSVFVIGGFLKVRQSFYQVDVSELIVPSVPVSCVLADSVSPTGPTAGAYEVLWATTLARVTAGDDIVLMAEESLYFVSAADEKAALTRAYDIAKTAADARGGEAKGIEVLIGVNYEMWLPENDYATNQFALVSSRFEEPVWNYLKAHPVPLVEADVKGGPWRIPIYDSLNLGRLSGAICFDFDFPPLISQAGREKVDIMLQASWTWNAISYRHFDNDAVRTIENGFTLFRCSSDGESGIVGPSGEVFSRVYTGHGPELAATFNLPLYERVNTVYAQCGGFVFEWIVAVLGGVYCLYTFAPRCALNGIYGGFLGGALRAFGLPFETDMKDNRPNTMDTFGFKESLLGGQQTASVF